MKSHQHQYTCGGLTRAASVMQLTHGMAGLHRQAHSVAAWFHSGSQLNVVGPPPSIAPSLVFIPHIALIEHIASCKLSAVLAHILLT